MKKIFCFLFVIFVFGSLNMAQENPKPNLNLSVSEQMAFSTVRIESEVGIGTGFFFRFLDEGNNYVPAIVTNKHVIKNSKVGTFFLTSADENGAPDIKKHIPVALDNFENRWIMHPDPNVDLAIMPIAPLLVEADQKGFHPFFIPLTKDIVPTADQLKDLTAVEDILMIGYPIGMWDSVNNYPIFRKGITATHPFNEYNGKSEFVIDAACFPGSSGSPVFLANLGNFVDKKGNTIIGTRIYFLGILYAGPMYDAEGKIVVIDIPTKKDTLTISEIPTNLGYVIKSKKLLEFDSVLEKLFNKNK
jgi:hypothetical protein